MSDRSLGAGAGSVAALVAAILTLSAFQLAYGSAPDGADYKLRPPQDEVIYFVLPDRFENADIANDRGGLVGDRLQHGYDPTQKGFYHGGDLKGLTERLDYIEGLGATAIWLGPIYKNKPVQGPPGDESAAYHGYWITDFTMVDPHFGTNDELKTFVDAAHERGIKVYLDIITNHTADVIAYRECHDPDYAGENASKDGCPYRSKADYPYTTRGPVNGAKINLGFMDDAAPFATTENFERLNRPDYAYTPFIPAGEEDVKRPAWLNDPRYYHNRGNSFFEGESSLYGDFSGLDDLQTEDPRVIEGFIDIYKNWISAYQLDGFRVDTVKHVNSEFWRAFVPVILEHAESIGIPNFYIFGEVYDFDPAGLAPYTRVDRLPAVLDFAMQSAVTDVVAKGEPTKRFDRLFKADSLYEGGAATAARLPVFLGNHDMGRFSMFVREANPGASDFELFKRVALGNAMIFFMRGAPVIYYGDEQGFVSDGGDQAAREDMFPSKVAIYNDNDLIGVQATTADSNFNRKHPLYKSFAKMAGYYRRHEALRRGAQQVRLTEREGKLIAISRFGVDGGEYLIIFNAGAEKRNVQITVDPRSTSWKSIHGKCENKITAQGSVQIVVRPLDYLICKSNAWSVAE